MPGAPFALFQSLIKWEGDAQERVGLGIAGLVVCLWRYTTYLRGLFQKPQDRSVRLGGGPCHIPHHRNHQLFFFLAEGMACSV